LPVLSTTVGAEGIDYVPGEELWIADDPGAFAEATVALLRDEGARSRLAFAGRRAVERGYDTRNVYDALEAVYAGVLGGGVRVPGAPEPLGTSV
jgi:glycosyltransferase involved in cell wall biosynthesis